MWFREKIYSGILFFFFFFPLLAWKVLICIRLSGVMTFNVINVTSIMPLTLSCLHLQNVNVSDYMTITRDPKEREETETQVSVLWVGHRAASRVIHCHRFGNTFTQCQKYDTHSRVCARTRTHTRSCFCSRNPVQFNEHSEPTL